MIRYFYIYKREHLDTKQKVWTPCPIGQRRSFFVFDRCSSLTAKSHQAFAPPGDRTPDRGLQTNVLNHSSAFQVEVMVINIIYILQWKIYFIQKSGKIFPGICNGITKTVWRHLNETTLLERNDVTWSQVENAFFKLLFETSSVNFLQISYICSNRFT